MSKINQLCIKCQKYIVINKTYGLCRLCNYERTHDGKNYFDKQKEKTTQKRLEKVEEMRFSLIRDKFLNSNVCKELGCGKTVVNKTLRLCNFHNKNRLNQQKRKKTNKEFEIKSKLSEIKKNVKKDKIICEGCLKNKQLQYSHILSVAQRKDLELEINNKNLLCQSCHLDWESWNPEKQFTLACIDYNLNYIRKNDEQTFWKIYFKCIDHQMIAEAKKMENIDEEFKKKEQTDE